MNITVHEVEKLLKGNQTFSQLGFSMLLEQMKIVYAKDPSSVNLQKCANEINAFLTKFSAIMAADYESIASSQTAERTSHVLTFDETAELIHNGKLLHIAGTETLLRMLPRGNWIGGSTEYFMASDGGMISDELLFVTEFPYDVFFMKSYDASDICDVGVDAFEYGFSILIVPFDSEVHKVYAENATGYAHMFIKHVTGWVAGVNLEKPGQKPVVINGISGKAFSDKAVALHLDIPDRKTIHINIINIFEQDMDSPVIEFREEGFSITKCLVGGTETILADYIEQNAIDTKLPLVGDYSGNGVNISFKSIENGIVNLYAPVFSGVKYRMAKKIPDYAEAFQSHISKIDAENSVFSCNCILNFLYGELEGKKIEKFNGPITFGEIAYQLVNQTLVYVTIDD